MNDVRFTWPGVARLVALLVFWAFVMWLCFGAPGAWSR